MEKFNFEKLEKKLKNLDLPDFELSQYKRVLRLALLNSPYFERKRFVFNFRMLAPSLGAVIVILLFVFLGYPYLQYFYLEAKAEGILDKTVAAIKSLGPNREIYVSTSGKEDLSFPFGKIQEALPLKETEDPAEKRPLEISFPPDQKLLKKIDLNLSQLKEAKERGDIKFFQYVGEEERNDTILKRIRYLDKNNIITEIKINAQTNLPAEIIIWPSQKRIKSPKTITNISPEKEVVTEVKIFKINNRIPE